jgi:hypothetical protein
MKSTSLSVNSVLWQFLILQNLQALSGDITHFIKKVMKYHILHKLNDKSSLYTYMLSLYKLLYMYMLEKIQKTLLFFEKKITKYWPTHYRRFIVSIEFTDNNEHVFPYYWMENWTSLIIKQWQKITQPLTTTDSGQRFIHRVIHFLRSFIFW